MLLDTGNSSIRQPLIILVALAVLVKLTFISWMYHEVPPKTERPEYTYIGNDHPRTWDIDLGHPVMMPFESSRHFNISSYEGTIEWESVAPDNGLIYLGKERRPFSISMFHQLRCLDVIRKRIINPLAHISEAVPDELLHHCINYIRQMALCRVDVTLEQTYAPPTGVKNNAQICNNWERVYEEQKINHKDA